MVAAEIEKNDLKQKCFFITPIGDPGTITRNRMDKILEKVLQGGLADLGYNCFRAKGSQAALTVEIIKSIIESHLIVADITDQNPNVFYELAFALTIGKPTCILQQKNIMFDNCKKLSKKTLKKLISGNSKVLVKNSEIIDTLQFLARENLIGKELIDEKGVQSISELFQAVQIVHLLKKPQNVVFNVKDAQIIYYEYALNGQITNIDDVVKKLRLFATDARQDENQTDTIILQALRQQANDRLVEILHSLLFLVCREDMHRILTSLHELFKASVEILGSHNGENMTKIFQYFEPKFFETHNVLCDYAYKSLRFRLVKDFGTYCRDCKDMVMRANPIDDNGILTIQTPVDFKILTKYENDYWDYLDRTISRIVDEKIVYKRLVLLNHDTATQVMKIESFLQKLITYAISKGVTELDHVEIGFVKLSKMDSLYNNIDFHITSTREFSVAFLSSSPQNKFGQSIHVYDVESDFASRMKSDIERIWNNTENCKLDLPSLHKSVDDTMNDLNIKITAIIEQA